MDKQYWIDRLDEVITDFEKGNVVHLSWRRFIAYGIFVLYLTAGTPLRIIQAFTGSERLNLLMSESVWNRIAFLAANIAVSALVLVLLCFLAGLPERRKEKARSSRHVEAAYSLYKPVVAAVAGCALAEMILSFYNASTVHVVIYPILLILVSFIIYITGRFSTRSIHILSIADTVTGIVFLLTLSVLHLIVAGPALGYMLYVSMKAISATIAVSLILTGIPYARFIGKNS